MPFGVQTTRSSSVHSPPAASRISACALRCAGYEPFKTSSIFDGTAQHPEWLGDEPQRVRQLKPR
jgi:hypothetical protein